MTSALKELTQNFDYCNDKVNQNQTGQASGCGRKGFL
jgi:hypothetical protein